MNVKSLVSSSLKNKTRTHHENTFNFNWDKKNFLNFKGWCKFARDLGVNFFLGISTKSDNPQDSDTCTTRSRVCPRTFYRRGRTRDTRWAAGRGRDREPARPAGRGPASACRADRQCYHRYKCHHLKCVKTFKTLIALISDNKSSDNNCWKFFIEVKIVATIT